MTPSSPSTATGPVVPASGLSPTGASEEGSSTTTCCERSACGGDTSKDVVDEIALRVDHHHTVARSDVLQNEPSQQSGLADASGAEDV